MALLDRILDICSLFLQVSILKMSFGHEMVDYQSSKLAANLNFGSSIYSECPSSAVRTVFHCNDPVTVYGFDLKDAYTSNFAPLGSLVQSD